MSSRILALMVLAGARLLAAPTAPATPATGPITLDGALTESSWPTAPWQTGFTSASAAEGEGGRTVAPQTRFKVLCDQWAMYVGIECDEPRLDQLRRNVRDHDGTVYADDCLEVFFDPAGQGRYYHHFIVNANGAWYDDYGADYGLVQGKLWDCPLGVGTAVDPAAKVWRVELRIPYAGLQLTPDAGANWLFNVARERQAGGHTELSTWSPLTRNFHQPRLFGRLTGVNLDPRRFALQLGEPQVVVAGGGTGRHQVTVRWPVANQTGGTVRLRPKLALFGQAQAAATAPELELAAGGSTEVTFPALELPSRDLTAHVQVAFDDVAAGQPVKIAVRSLATVYRPLAVKMTWPVYRQNLYATETRQEFVFDAELGADAAGRARTVRYRLVDDTGATKAEGTAAADRTRGLRLPATTLPEGRYTLAVTALDGDRRAIAESRTIVRKLPRAKGSEVRVDQHRNLLVNGRPKVFLGWYGNVPTEDPRPEVVALQNVQTPVVLNGTDASPIRRAFEQRGIYSVVSIEPGRLYYSFELWRRPGNTVAAEHTKLSAPSEECRGYVKRLVEAVRDEPGLLGYYLADEPEINNTRSDYLEAFWQMMQELDPYHPVMITNDTIDGIATHGYKCCDVLNPDPYSPEPEYVPNFLKKVREVAPAGKGVMLTPWHSAGQTHFTETYGANPPYPYRVMRHQFLAAVTLDCRGFTGYTTPFFMPEIELRYGLPPIWATIRFLEAAMASPAEPVKVEADQETLTWVRRVGGQVYVIVVNHKPGTRRVRLSSPAFAGLSELDVVAEGRTLAVANGVLTDELPAGAARIYSTDPAGRALPLTTAVEADLAERTKAAAKPGNLLHSSRGVRARASEGYYAPWFTQYYYYAINGITDDDGWYCSHAGDQPAWLELTLPKAERIGRVVVYTPNLRDFDLRFAAPDGSAQLAQVRGNTAEVAELSFRPSIAALKLRITALATRPGTQPARAMVREIEAYAEPGNGQVVPVRAAAQTAAPVFQAPPEETAGQPALWVDRFDPFATSDRYKWDGKDDYWVLTPTKLRTEPQPGGGLVVCSIAPEGYAGMTRIRPYEAAYRWFQIDLNRITGEGYRFVTVLFGDSSGKPGYRIGVNSSRPGIYTIDTHYVHPSFRAGSAKQCFVVVSVAGSAKQADGTIKPGPQVLVRQVRLGRRPQNGLAVTMADGSPLPEVLKAGDELLFRVFLGEPATDVTVETQVDSMYQPVPINGEPQVQLVAVGARDGREWAAKVKLGERTGKVDGRKGYPVVFRAVVSGAKVGDIFQSAGVKFE